MDQPRYLTPVATVLEEIASPEGALGSGAAVTLALSLGIECVGLWLAVASRSPSSVEGAADAGLRDRITQWRARTADAFARDSEHVGVIIEARRRRDAAGDADKARHVAREVEALTVATRGLIDLMHIAGELEADAAAAAEGGRAAHLSSELVGAGSLARAAAETLQDIVSTNVRTLRRRRAEYGIGADGLEVIRDAVQRLPAGPARARMIRTLEEPEGSA